MAEKSDVKERLKLIGWIMQASVEEIILKAEVDDWESEELKSILKTKEVQFLEKIATRGIYTQEKV